MVWYFVKHRELKPKENDGHTWVAAKIM